MMLPPIQKYIPTGCLRLSRKDVDFDANVWTDENLHSWRYLGLPEDSQACNQYLDPELQHSLIKARKLRKYARLVSANWIKLSFRIISSGEDYCALRVYLLPDDSARDVIDRSDPNLQKARKALLSELNYSRDAWNDHCEKNYMGTPRPFGSSDGFSTEESTSLLTLFNTIPAPNPTPDSLVDVYAKTAMNMLLNGTTSGIRPATKLFPHQRRSAAFMLQKEIQPGTFIDPRLTHVTDQEQSDWYLDPVAGTILREPRYYDGISGGILGENLGTGKTLICLALILATKDFPTRPPEANICNAEQVRIRKKIGSLADMAASCATRNAVPWKPYFETYKAMFGEEYSNCIAALNRNHGYYLLPQPTPRRSGRRPSYYKEVPKEILLSSASVVLVPDNLVAQWKQEIFKHTEGLSVLTLFKNDKVPSLKNLLEYDIILISQPYFERIAFLLSRIHFKRCIVDEGHTLGNSRIGNKSNLLRSLDAMYFTSRWIVTGTPSRGLYGVDSSVSGETVPGSEEEQQNSAQYGEIPGDASVQQERKDLEKIGSMTALYLKARPWANSDAEAGDTSANWTVYLMLPKHSRKSRGRWDCLRSTLNSLIIRHQVIDVKDLLPPVQERVVKLEGSYQDVLSMNLFSMMIIFNSVQSQRTDMDYFFHPRQRKSLLQIVSNLRQASFFGPFFTSEEILKAVQTAEKFLLEKKIPISFEDKVLLEQGIELGYLAISNSLRNVSNQYHEPPLLVENFPTFASQAWSLDGQSGSTLCTSSNMLFALQKRVATSAATPKALNSLLNGGLIEEGMSERERLRPSETSSDSTARNKNGVHSLAGNTKLGNDKPRKTKPHGVDKVAQRLDALSDTCLGPLQSTKISATVSAKLSYLVNSIVKYQDKEKIIVFYDNDNIAWYLGGALEVVSLHHRSAFDLKLMNVQLHIQHLIYAKGITTERRAQYVNTFHHNPVFR